MKRKLLLAGTALGLALTGAWTRPAAALYRTCSFNYCSTVSSTTGCTCPGTTHSATCGTWQSGGCELP